MRLSTLLAFSSLLTLPLAALAQAPITITQNDMPNVGDTLRVSNGIPDPTLNFQQAGPNQTWDFSQLIPTSQSVYRFVSVSSTGFPYSLTFGAFGGVNRATIAAPGELPLDSIPGGGGLTLSNIYGFFNESAQDFRQVGFGGSVGGLPIPVTYQSQQEQDVILRFPLTFGARDSSNSAFQVNVPNTAFLAQRQKRVNHCDGWGTLTTPFGTFNTLRVVTTLDTYDSLALNGQMPIAFQIPTQHEYKWFANGQGIPLLTITTTNFGGSPAITGIEYRDHYRQIRFPTASGEEASLPGLTVVPNPASVGQPVVLRGLPATGAAVEVFDALGRSLLRHAVTGAEARLDLGYAHGILILRVSTAHGTAVRRLVRE